MSEYAVEGINFTMKAKPDGTMKYSIICEYCSQFVINPCKNHSWEHNIKQHVAPTDSSSKTNSKGGNHYTNKIKLAGQLRMTSFVSISPSVSANDFENPTLALLCLGLPVEKGSMEEELLFNLHYRSTLDFVSVFRPIPLTLIAMPETAARDIIVGHAFRHVHCSESSPFSGRPYSNHICQFCKNIVHMRQFIREMQKREAGIHRSRAYIDDHNDFLGGRMTELAKSNTAMRRILLRNAKKNARAPATLSKTLKVRKQEMKAKSPCVFITTAFNTDIKQF